MATLLGQPAPDFTLKSNSGPDITLSSFRGAKNVLLIFYPLDFSPVCSIQLPEFSSQRDFFDDEATEIIGVNRDSIHTHKAWAKEYGISVPLLSDMTGSVARKFGVFNDAANMSKRATFLIDKSGKVVLEHIEAEAGDYTLHVGEMLDRLKQLNSQPA